MIMPSCKNDPKRHFKGCEPSPKGRGYCAHADPAVKKRIGGDRKMWIVKTYKTKAGKNVKRWVHLAAKKPKKTGLVVKKPKGKKKAPTKFQGGGFYSSAKNAASGYYSDIKKAVNRYAGKVEKVPDTIRRQRKEYLERLPDLEHKAKSAKGAEAQTIQEEIAGIHIILELFSDKYPQAYWDWN